MSIPRRLEPELLDHLPADDPRAMRSRHDLKRVNALMGNVGAMAAMLKTQTAGREPRTILDLGSGDGQLMLNVARRLAPRWRNVRVILLDRKNIVSEATRKSFAALQWRAEPVSADVFEFLAAVQPGSVDVVSANLFLHHFTDEQLAGLFARAAGLAWLVLACEPSRTKLVIELSRLLWALGCNDVTVHDAIASARAGFAGRELSALWPSRGQWELQEPATGLFNHCFSARCRDGN
jgi:SAM-dependent methyltransferase